MPAGSPMTQSARSRISSPVWMSFGPVYLFFFTSRASSIVLSRLDTGLAFSGSAASKVLGQLSCFHDLRSSSTEHCSQLRVGNGGTSPEIQSHMISEWRDCGPQWYHSLLLLVGIYHSVDWYTLSSVLSASCLILCVTLLGSLFRTCKGTLSGVPSKKFISPEIPTLACLDGLKMVNWIQSWSGLLLCF